MRTIAASLLLSIAPALAADPSCSTCEPPHVWAVGLKLAPRTGVPSPRWFSLADTHLILACGPCINPVALTPQETAATPPSGPVTYLSEPMGMQDYLLNIEQVATAEGYHASLHLESLWTRERLASKSFDIAIASTDQQIADSISTAADSLGTLAKVIADFENAKRAGDNTVALWPANSRQVGLTASPQKRTLEPGESTDVQLELKDCDGQALAGREVILEAVNHAVFGELPGPSGGTVSPTRVLTDASGQATVTFTAGNRGNLGAQEGVIHAYLIYNRPTGQRAYLRTSAFVNIAAVPVWVLTTSFNKRQTVHEDRAQASPFGDYTRSFQQLSERTNYQFAGVCTDTDSTPTRCSVLNAGQDTIIMYAPPPEKISAGMKFRDYPLSVGRTGGSNPTDHTEITSVSYMDSIHPDNSTLFAFDTSGSLKLTFVRPVSWEMNQSIYDSFTGWEETHLSQETSRAAAIECKAGDPGSTFKAEVDVFGRNQYIADCRQTTYRTTLAGAREEFSEVEVSVRLWCMPPDESPSALYKCPDFKAPKLPAAAPAR